MPKKGRSGGPLVSAGTFDSARAALREAYALVESDKRRIAMGQAT